MAEILTRPAALGRPAVAGGDYALGLRPRLSMYLDGSLLWDTNAPYKRELEGRHAYFLRVDIENALDRIPTLTLTMGGDECILYCKETFKRGSVVEARFGYDDVPETFHPQNQERTLWRGEVTQAEPNGAFPPMIDLLVDGTSYKTREYREQLPEDADAAGDFLASRLKSIGLESNFLDGVKNEANVTYTEGDGTLLSYMQRWTEANNLHWLDTMENSIAFLFPSGRYRYFGQENIDWIFRMRGPGSDAREAPILGAWPVELAYVDVPSEIVIPYFKRGAETAEIITITNEEGRPETSYTTPPISVMDESEAEAWGKSLLKEHLWRMAQVPFELSVGVPVLPMDDIAATGGYPGLEEFYDVYFRVIETHLTYDARGLTTRGRARSIV